MIQALPWRIKMQKVQKTPRKTIPPGKVSAWIEAAEKTAFKSNRWEIGTALRLMIGLGLREQEALGARWEWVDWERCTYTVGKAKGFEARVIPVPAWLAAWLVTRKADLGLILGGKHPAGFTRKAIYGANQACGTPGISAHRLRGSFATIHSETGTPVQVIQAMLGHKSAATTMLYLESHQEKATEQQTKVAERMGMA
jgi:integrase